MILVSGSASDFGKVKKANCAVLNALGYKLKDLRGLKVELIMPALIKECHASFVERFKEEGVTKKLHTSINTFVVKKNGYLLPV